jgi:uncharacterized protein (TIGR02996 family)
MNDQDFVRAILADPGNDSVRLAYADWLEERGDPRAEYLRLDAELANPELRNRERVRLENRRLEIHVAVDPRRTIEWLEKTDGTHAECVAIDDALLAMDRRDLQRDSMRLRLDDMRGQIEPRWLALLDRPPVENCDIRFKFRCPKQWQSLTLTAESQVRFCDACRKTVYYCGTLGEARDHARQGHCVAVCSHEKRTPDDLIESRDTLFLGDLAEDELSDNDSQDFVLGGIGSIVDREENREPQERNRWWKFW